MISVRVAEGKEMMTAAAMEGDGKPAACEEEEEEEGRAWDENDDEDGGNDYDREEGGGRRDPMSSSHSRGGDAYDDLPRKPTIRDELEGDSILFGVFPVLNALKAGRRKLYALYVLATLDLSKRKDAASMREVFKLAADLDIPVLKVERHDLNLLSDDKVHQGLVLDCSPLQWAPLESFPTAAEIAAQARAPATPLTSDDGHPPSPSSSSLKEGAAAAVPSTLERYPAPPPSPFPIWLALDEVVDPQNFGAVVRSTHVLGAAGILACSRNCAPLSASVSKASAGVLEVCPVHSTSNMVRTLQQAVADGWDVLGAVGADQRAQECRRFKVTKPTILVVGNEGAGLRTNVKRACSGYIKVEMGGPGGVGGGRGGLPRQLLAADSLNVSVAAGILMHALTGSAAAAASTAAAPASTTSLPSSNLA